jgi:hypothetical protein
MPIFEHPFSNNPYFRYGKTGHKYYYIKYNESSRQKAYKQALQQTKAIHANKRRI